MQQTGVGGETKGTGLLENLTEHSVGPLPPRRRRTNPPKPGRGSPGNLAAGLLAPRVSRRDAPAAPQQDPAALLLPSPPGARRAPSPRARPGAAAAGNGATAKLSPSPRDAAARPAAPPCLRGSDTCEQLDLVPENLHAGPAAPARGASGAGAERSGEERRGAERRAQGGAGARRHGPGERILPSAGPERRDGAGDGAGSGAGNGRIMGTREGERKGNCGAAGSAGGLREKRSGVQRWKMWEISGGRAVLQERGRDS